MNSIEEKKLTLRKSFLKAKIRVTHYLLTQIILLRQDNIEVIIREDVVPLGKYNVFLHAILQVDLINRVTI